MYVITLLDFHSFEGMKIVCSSLPDFLVDERKYQGLIPGKQIVSAGFSKK
jgi:hypothetical protein